jgi:spore cortex biosynthesis protein YabQ
MIQNQTYVFLCSLFVGVILAVIFDFFRILRRKGNTPNYMVYIQDIIYWIIVTFIIIMSAFITNDGELRGYMFIGYILGAVVYIVTISQYILKFVNIFLDAIEKKFKKTNEIFSKILEKTKIKNKNVNL